MIPANESLCGSGVCWHLQQWLTLCCHCRKYQGLTFAAIVGDRCGECEDDHVDVLIDRPLSYSYYDPNLLDYDTKLPVNAKAPLVSNAGTVLTACMLPLHNIMTWCVQQGDVQ